MNRESDVVEPWLSSLERRHMADLTFPRLRRGVQALSSLYVERRTRLGRGAALDGAAKRAAFALFFAPLHFVLTRSIVRELGAARRSPRTVYDLGCGTGAAGAAWALETRPESALVGWDLHPWAVSETRWNWSRLGLRGTARRGRLERVDLPQTDVAVLLAWTVNELSDADREGLWNRLEPAVARGTRVLVIEPIARRVVPWWDEWSRRFEAHGGRSDRWRFDAEMPDAWKRLDRAAGLDHRRLSARSLFAGRG